MTGKLYYQDAGLFDFEAMLVKQVRESGELSDRDLRRRGAPESRPAAGGRWIAILDRSAFYPEGGGQPADRGWLNEVPVLDVQEKDGEILHFLPEPLSEEKGRKIEGKIDSSRRFDFMQQHTGQHLVSASLFKTGGFQTLSVHMGETYTAVEIDTPAITEAEITAVEDLANRIVNQNLSVRIHLVHTSELPRFQLRKAPPDREKLRIVEIEHFDACACGGTHLASTGQVGLIKAVDREKRRGRIRLHWKIGARAYLDYRENIGLISALSRELTCGRGEILTAVQSLQERLKDLGRQAARTEERLAGILAESLFEQAAPVYGVRIILSSFKEEAESLIQGIFNRLLKEPAGAPGRGKIIAGLVNFSGAQVQWKAGVSGEISLPLYDLIHPLLPLIEGRGGGKFPRWQGIGRKPAGANVFLEELEKAVIERLSNNHLG